MTLSNGQLFLVQPYDKNCLLASELDLSYGFSTKSTFFTTLGKLQNQELVEPKIFGSPGP